MGRSSKKSGRKKDGERWSPIIWRLGNHKKVDGKERNKAMWTKPAAGCVHNLDALHFLRSDTTCPTCHVIE
jgi:hypothetical protein